MRRPRNSDNCCGYGSCWKRRKGTGRGRSPDLLGHRAEVDTPEFWFLMQVAMLSGFATSYPVNWWLIRSGIKEKM